MSESNLEDRAMIHDLFTRYCCALDNGEIETVVDCFTADAILKSPVIAGVFEYRRQGVGALCALRSRRLAQLLEARRANPFRDIASITTILVEPINLP